MKPQQIQAWINPLAFLEVDAPWALTEKTHPTVESILKFLCPADASLDIEEILRRYREISTEPVRLLIAPADQRILDKLVWPLRHAKASYMVGNYLATISLSGMVAEMVTLLIWEMSNPQVNGHSMTKDDEKNMYGYEFEKLGQERRVAVLTTYGNITSAAKQNFEIIRLIRKRYLHLWSQDHDRLPDDAIKCYHTAVSLVVEVIGQDIQNGKLALNPNLLAYLERKGLYQSPNPDEPNDAG